MTSASHALLSSRNREILFTLTKNIRLLTINQVARTWFQKTARPEANARRALRELERAGYLERLTLMAHPEIALTGPELEWTPGDSQPHLGPVAYRLKARWSDPVVATEIVVATKRTRNLLGGGSRRPRPAEVTHDIHLAGVYLWYGEHEPGLASRWVSEDALLKTSLGPEARRPDAVIRNTSGRTERVVEFGGAYSKTKLQAFHHENRHRPYQIW